MNPTIQASLNYQLAAMKHLQDMHTYGIVAAEACEVAGQIICEAYSRAFRAESISFKGVGDYLTEVDQESNTAILKILKLATPNIPIVSEENENGTIRLEKLCWIVDPLDGTAAFIFKTGAHHPAVMIALQNNLQVELGVVYLPLTKEWFFADPNKGSFYYSSKVQGKKLAMNPCSLPLNNSWIALNHYGDASFETKHFQNLRTNLRSSKGAGLVTIEVPHSALGCRMLLDNGPAAVVHDNNSLKVKQAIWDLAPVKAIIENAEGVVLQFDGSNYQLNSEGPIIMARNWELAEQIISLCRNV